MTKRHWAAILAAIVTGVVLLALAGDTETLRGNTSCRASSIRSGRC
jgi:hypothetical protein